MDDTPKRKNLAFLLPGITAALLFFSCSAKKKVLEQETKRKKEKFLYVETVYPRWQMSRETLEVQGEVKPDKISKVGAEVTGKVQALFVKEGDQVRRGEVLLKLDSRDLQTKLKALEETIRQAQASLKLLKKGARKEEIKQAQANVEATESAYALALKNEERLKKLFAEGAVSLSEVEGAMAQREQAEARWHQAQEAFALLQKGAQEEEIEIQESRLKQALLEKQSLLLQIEKTTVRAPFDGIVDQVLTQKGEIASPGMPLFLLLGEPFFFEARVAESYRSGIKPGLRVIVKSNTQEHQARLDKVMPTISPETRSFAVRAFLPLRLYPPGSYLTGEILLSEERLLLVPEKSVKQEEDKTYLFLVKEGKARKVEVRGKWVKEGFAIFSGAQEKDEVITTLSTYLAEGTPVKVLK